MNDIQAAELCRGFVMHLDGTKLAQQENVQSNCEPGREVRGEHYFVLLEKLEDARWVAVPLFSQNDMDRIMLETKLKVGLGVGWKQRESFFHPMQHWIAPESALLAALSNDDSIKGSRRSYAIRHADRLNAIASLRSSNYRPFRNLREVP